MGTDAPRHGVARHVDVLRKREPGGNCYKERPDGSHTLFGGAEFHVILTIRSAVFYEKDFCPARGRSHGSPARLARIAVGGRGYGSCRGGGKRKAGGNAGKKNNPGSRRNGRGDALAQRTGSHAADFENAPVNEGAGPDVLWR